MARNIVWFSWRDSKHPEAGGAELVQHELCKRLAADGNTVTVITSRKGNTKEKEQVDGYNVVRRGNRYTVYLWAVWRYLRSFRAETDLVVEEINTVPFFTKFYARKQRILLFHQLCREIWFYQYFFPLSYAGFWLEPLYLRLIHDQTVIAMSESTKADLMKHGFNKDSIHIISEGITLPAVKDPAVVKKKAQPSLLAFGSVRPMKRTLHIIEAFEAAKKKLPDLKLTIAGSDSGKYADSVRQTVSRSRYANDILMTGRVDSDKERMKILQSHHFIASAALKEGWGLTISEAGSQGTPAIAYNVDGQRDAVKHNKTGILVEPHVEALTKGIVSAFSNTEKYSNLQDGAWRFARNLTFEQSYADFTKVLSQTGAIHAEK